MTGHIDPHHPDLRVRNLRRGPSPESLMARKAAAVRENPCGAIAESTGQRCQYPATTTTDRGPRCKVHARGDTKAARMASGIPRGPVNRDNRKAAGAYWRKWEALKALGLPTPGGPNVVRPRRPAHAVNRELKPADYAAAKADWLAREGRASIRECGGDLDLMRHALWRWACDADAVARVDAAAAVPLAYWQGRVATAWLDLQRGGTGDAWRKLAQEAGL